MASLEPLTIDTELCEFTVPVAFQRVPAWFYGQESVMRYRLAFLWVDRLSSRS